MSNMMRALVKSRPEPGIWMEEVRVSMAAGHESVCDVFRSWSFDGAKYIT